MTYLRTDQYTHVSSDCPVGVDVYPADDLVEISLGEHRINGNSLRLLVGHPDTCLRLAEAMRDAHNKLIEHLGVKACPDPVMSELDSPLTAST